MIVNVNNWEKMARHLSTSQTKPPTAVYLLINALINGADIKTGWAEQSSNGTTTVWRNWIVTETHLVHTDVEFAAENYDSIAETQTASPAPVVRHASAHLTANATAMSIGEVGPLSGFRGDWYPIDAVTLTFADGTHVPLPGQSSVAVGDRDSSELFYADLRHNLPI